MRTLHTRRNRCVHSSSFTGNRRESQALTAFRNTQTTSPLAVAQGLWEQLALETGCIVEAGRKTKKAAERRNEKTFLSGRSTHLPRRGRYGGDLGRISGFPEPAGHAHRPQRSIPFMYIFPRDVISSHTTTIGLSFPASQEYGTVDRTCSDDRLRRQRGLRKSLSVASFSLPARDRHAMEPTHLDTNLGTDRAIQGFRGIVAFDQGLHGTGLTLHFQ